MKKISMVLLVGVLMLASTMSVSAHYWNQTYNSTDIFYNYGKVGIGTTTPAYKLDIDTTDTGGIRALISSISGGETANYARIITTGTGVFGGLRGTDSNIWINSDVSSMNQARGGVYKITMDSLSTETTNITNSVDGLFVTIADGYDNAQDFNIKKMNFLSLNSVYNDNGGGKINVSTDLIGIDIPDLKFPSNNTYGIKIAKQTSGTNNYGIVLDGDGSGSDLVLGGNQESRIYGNSGDIVLNPSSDVNIPDLSGNGTAYVCVDSSGNLYRSLTACV